MRIITRITPPGAKKKQKEKPPLRVAAYCRVSTERPEQETSLDLQVRYYTQRIESTPGWVNAGVFAEKASGLSIKRRKEFQRLLDSCRNGEIDMVLVKSVSRFGRDSLEMFKILREFQDLDVDVFFEEEGVHSWGSLSAVLSHGLLCLCPGAERERKPEYPMGHRAQL